MAGRHHHQPPGQAGLGQGAEDHPRRFLKIELHFSDRSWVSIFQDIVRRSPTVNIFLGIRLTDADPERAKGALSHLQMYPYAQRDNPPKMEVLDAGTKAWSGLPPRGMAYWERLDDVIQSEPIEPRDIFYHAMLRPLGLEKGQPFKPDARQTRILTDAALVGEAMAKANTAERRFAGGRFRPDAHRDLGTSRLASTSSPSGPAS